MHETPITIYFVLHQCSHGINENKFNNTKDWRVKKMNTNRLHLQIWLCKWKSGHNTMYNLKSFYVDFR